MNFLLLSLYSLIGDFGKSQINANGLIFGPICYCDDMYLSQIGKCRPHESVYLVTLNIYIYIYICVFFVFCLKTMSLSCLKIIKKSPITEYSDSSHLLLLKVRSFLSIQMVRYVMPLSSNQNPRGLTKGGENLLSKYSMVPIMCFPTSPLIGLCFKTIEDPDERI